MLATNFRDHAVVFTQLELGDEAFSTVELYSECPSVRAAEGLLAELPPDPPRAAPHSCTVAGWPPTPSEGRVLQAGRDAAPGPRAGVSGRPRGEGPSGQTPARTGLQPQASQGRRLVLPPGRKARASRASLSLFSRWSRGLGFLSQQQATLQPDRERHQQGLWGHSLTSVSLGDPPVLREPCRSRGGVGGVPHFPPRVGPVGPGAGTARWVLGSPAGQGAQPASRPPPSPPVTCAQKAFQVSGPRSITPGAGAPGSPPPPWAAGPASPLPGRAGGRGRRFSG